MSGLRFAAALAVMGLMSAVGGFAAVAVFSGKAVQAEGEKNIVQATEYQLQSADGTTRGVWGVTDEGMALFSIMDKQGNPRLNMAQSDKEGMLLSFMDGKNRLCMSQNVLPDGGAIITFYHPNGKTAFQVSSTGKGDSTLILNEKDQKSSAMVAILEDGRSVMALTKDGQVRYRAMLGKDGTPEAAFINEKNEYTWKAGK